MTRGQKDRAGREGLSRIVEKLIGSLHLHPWNSLPGKSMPFCWFHPTLTHSACMYQGAKSLKKDFLIKAFKRLTARRLWLISAPSIFVCLSESLASAALSLPAKSMKEILEKRHSRDDFFGALVYFYISQHFVTARRN